jgi:hypothetical protein
MNPQSISRTDDPRITVTVVAAAALSACSPVNSFKAPNPVVCLRGPRALNGLLHDFLDAHESVLSAACPRESNEDHSWVRDFAVGRVVLTNEQQCEPRPINRDPETIDGSERRVD